MYKITQLHLILRALLVIALLAVLPPTAAHAASITVNTLDDELNSAGDCSLREAITAANTNAAVDACPAGSGAVSDTITFSVSGIIGLNGGTLPAITDIAGLTIDGTGQSVTISGNNAVRVLFVDIELGGPVTLQSLTVAHGSAGLGGGVYINSGSVTISDSTFFDNHAGNSGGAIFNDHSLTITGSTFSGNSANGSNFLSGGGAIYGGATIANSTFSGNSASRQGGAILNLSNDSVIVIESAFADNSAEAGGAIFTWEGTWLTITDSAFPGNNAEDGGAIYNLDGVVTVMNSTFSGNSANNSGGGIYNIYGPLNVTNSTFSGNSAADSGGGIYNHDTSLNVLNSTFSGNSAVADGGAIRNNFSNPTTLYNTIVANSPSGGNCAGLITDGGNNLQSPGQTCGDTIPTADPLLGLLANNGGPTLTHALLPGSPAIDAGNPAGCTDHLGNILTTDQRGVARPADGNGDGTATCDIGAFEVEVAIPPSPSELLNNLTTAVNDSVAGGNISGGVGTALLSKLQTAQKKFESGQTNAAVNVLQAFINSVEAQRGKKISAATADDLIGQAQAIIEQLQP